MSVRRVRSGPVLGQRALFCVQATSRALLKTISLSSFGAAPGADGYLGSFPGVVGRCERNSRGDYYLKLGDPQV